MEDRLLVEALRSRDPGALAAVYDEYATRLYAYCWSHLLNRDAAQVALRDTFIVAEAHIDRLRDIDRFAPWIYAIARIECARRMPLPGQRPDLPIASHDQPDVDQRLLSWRAVRSLGPREREALELRVLHQLAVPDFALVLDRPQKEVQELLDEARTGLRSALAAEILAHLGPHGCDGRAAILADRDGGELDPVLRARLLAHAGACTVCGGHRPAESLSPAKVFGLLPYADAPPSLRVRVMSCFTDPELVSYRLFVATRVTEFTAAGFPRQGPRAIAPVTTRVRRFARIGLVSAVVVAGAITAASFVGWLASDQTRDAETTASHSTPDDRTTLAPGSAGPSPSGTGTGPVSATFPLGARESSVPEAVAVPEPSPPRPGEQSPPPHVPQSGSDGTGTTEPPGGPGRLEVSPHYLDVGTGSGGTVTLHATGGGLVWRARATGPIRLSAPSGKLKEGESVTLSVHVFRSASSRGEGSLTFGTTTVTVTWRPTPPPATPPPIATPTPEPSPSGTPSPTPTGPSPTSPPPTTPPHTTPPRTTPPHTTPPHTDPPATDPPATTPPPTGQPTSEPPASTPPKDQETTAPGTTSAAPDA
ncbi:hypothetical protein [Actinocorallia longicatena]|uniref:RNA polymerase sigma factor (Sigma-70 family) n=1 Tax=Actinocorallia longicatena TaxID=111803 RepID=A0ABP6QM35_9ACTN